MARGHAYPPDLTRYVEARWPTEHPLRVSRDTLCEVVSVAFQASMTAEEARPIRFRLLVMPFADLPEDGVANVGVLRLRFDASRSLHADELRRLSPSVPFETSLIGVQLEDDKLRIWGVAHSGPAWLAPSWGGRSLVPNWTYDPIVHATGPGQIAVRCAGTLVGALERGEIVDVLMDVFDSSWLPALFAHEREAVREEYVAQSESRVAVAIELSLIGRIAQHMLRRAIQLVRNARHGGMFLIVDTTVPQALRGVRLKFRFGQDEPSHRYRTLLFRILDGVAASAPESSASIGWADFQTSTNPSLERLEQSVFEWSRLIGNLTAVDGAVVLDKRFGVLGFGAEVSAELPSPSFVWRARDTEGDQREAYDIENVGTRHRAAYRFIGDHPQGLAIVVSSDGGVTFVANRGGEVVFWEQSVSP